MPRSGSTTCAIRSRAWVSRSESGAAITCFEGSVWRRRLINLQRDGAHARPYQVRQVRAVILNAGLGDWE